MRVGGLAKFAHSRSCSKRTNNARASNTLECNLMTHDPHNCSINPESESISGLFRGRLCGVCNAKCDMDNGQGPTLLFWGPFRIMAVQRCNDFAHGIATVHVYFAQFMACKNKIFRSRPCVCRPRQSGCVQLADSLLSIRLLLPVHEGHQLHGRTAIEMTAGCRANVLTKSFGNGCADCGQKSRLSG